MAMQAHLADGTVLEFPDGTAPSVIDGVVKQHVTGSASTAPGNAAGSPRARSYGATDLAASKFTFGLGDKVGAAGDAVGGYLHDLVAGKPSADLGSRYDTSYAAEIAAKKQYQDAHPTIDALTSPLSFVAGGPAATGLKGVRAGIVAGTAAGGVQAAGDARGTVGQQAGQIALGAGLGAATGGVAAHLVPKVVAAAAPVVQRIAGRLTPNLDAGAAQAGTAAAPTSINAPLRPSRAQTVIADAMAADGNSPRQVGQMVQAAQQRGVPMAIADTGDNVRGLAGSVSRQPGPGKTVMRDAVVARQEGQGERVQGAVTRDLGPTVGVATEAQRLEDSAKSAAAPLYDAAYASGPVDHPTITALLQHPEMQQALQHAQNIHANETFLAKATGQEPPAPLTPGAPDVRTLDYTKRALDQKIDAAYSGDSAGKLQIPFLKNLRGTLLSSLDQASPEYAAARAAYAGPMQSAEALASGKAALNKSGDEIAADTAKLSPSELDQYRLGHRSALSDAVESKVDGADKVKALVGTPKKRAALDQLYGGSANLDNFLATLADEGKTSATYGAVNTGSPTAGRLADDNGLSNMTDMARAGYHLAHGNALAAVAGLVSHLKTAASGKAGEVTRAEIASALSETDPAVLADALRQATRAQAQSRVNNRMAARTAPAAAAAAGRTGGYVGSLLGGGQ